MQLENVELSLEQEKILDTLEEQVQLHYNVHEIDDEIEQEMEPSTRRGFVSHTIKHTTSPRAQQKQQKGKAYMQQLQKYDHHCSELKQQVQKAIDICDSIELEHTAVNLKTNALHDSCATIIGELQSLNEKLSIIEMPLPYFNDLQDIALAIGLKVIMSDDIIHFQREENKEHPYHHQNPVIDPTTLDYSQRLTRIDECIAYLSNHTEYRDADLFANGFRALMTNALEIVHDHALQQLEKVTKETLAASASVEIFDEAHPVYTAFHSIQNVLQTVTKQISYRASYSVYKEILVTTYSDYADKRLIVLRPCIIQCIDEIARQDDLLHLIKLGCAFMIRICKNEYDLFLTLFGKEAQASAFFTPTPTATGKHKNNRHSQQNSYAEEEEGFQRMIFQLSRQLYECVRSLVVVEENLDVLCETVQTLRIEILEDQIQSVGENQAFEPLEPFFDRMVEDAQERLIFCTQQYIQDNIEEFYPEPQDLAYPTRLQELVTEAAPIYKSWHPTLEFTLLLLSKIYRYLNAKIFEELAQDIIQSCVASLKIASADITVKCGELDGSLFLVKNLLTLREQITPFDLSGSVKAKELDFTNTTGAMNHMLSDVGAIFTFSKDNSLLGLITHGIPQIQMTESNVKQDLENQLKLSCTNFIQCVVKLLFLPLASFLKQTTSYLQKCAEHEVKLSDQTFGMPVALKAILSKCHEHIKTNLLDIQAKVNLYLNNEDTARILFKPIERSLLDSIEQLNQLIATHYSADATMQDHLYEATEILIRTIRSDS